eukprot:gene3081-3360_t
MHKDYDGQIITSSEVPDCKLHKAAGGVALYIANEAGFACWLGLNARGTKSGNEAELLEPALYVVGTPIGNLEDISFRALRILRSVNLILAEDTRHTRKLLEYFGIRTSTLSFHQHNEKQREEVVLQRLQQGEPIALVSDAGMPAISDPGALLVARAVGAGVKVVPVPGPCAAITALAAGGLNTDNFYFLGFLPPKTGKRQAALQQVQHVTATLVFYAPPHGLGAILQDNIAVLGGHRQAVVARELTKLHEEFFRGTLADCLEEFGPGGRRQVKGEVVLLVDGCREQQSWAASAEAASGDLPAPVAAAGAIKAATSADADAQLRQLLQRELSSGGTVSASAKLLSQQLKVPRSRIYKLALEVEAQLQQRQQ